MGKNNLIKHPNYSTNYFFSTFHINTEIRNGGRDVRTSNKDPIVLQVVAALSAYSASSYRARGRVTGSACAVSTVTSFISPN